MKCRSCRARHRHNRPRSSSALRPIQADRVAPVPIACGVADLIEDAHAGRCRLGHLDDRAGMAFIEEIDERAARGVALLADLPAGRQGARADLAVVHRPARPVLHPLMPRGEEIAVEAWGFAALLDQFELHIARIGEGGRDLDVVAAALVAELVHRQLLGIKPRADAADLDPMAHRLVDVAHDDPDLTHRPEQAAHRFLPPQLGVSLGRLGHCVAHLADMVVVLLDHAELPGDQRSHIERQVFLERARIGFLRIIFAPLAFGQNRPIVHPADRQPDIHPAAMRRAKHREAAPRVAAKLADLGPKLGCALRTALRRMLEKACELGVSDPVGTGLKPGFAIVAGFDQLAERRDHILPVHRRILPWRGVARTPHAYALNVETGEVDPAYVTRRACHSPVPNWLRLTMPAFWSLAAPSATVPAIAPSLTVPSNR